MSQINETAIKTPGVYVNEIPSFPPSVAQVATAIPVFIGYTDFAKKIQPGDLNMIPTRITSLVEYNYYFGYGPGPGISTVEIDSNNAVTKVSRSATYYMYDSIKMFYLNGGSVCFIVSIGTYQTVASYSKDDFLAGIAALIKYDEPTIILFPDAVLLNGLLYDVQTAALALCNTMQDRFCILDMLETPDWNTGKDNFRNNIGVQNLNYGAAYTPYLKTTLGLSIVYKDLKGKIFQAGQPIDLKNFTSSNDAKNTIESLNRLISDTTTITTAINGQLLGNNKTLAQQWLSNVNDYQASFTLSGPTDNEGKFQALITFIYTIANIVDDWANNLQGDYSGAGLKSDVGNFITNSLKDSMTKLLAYDQGAFTKMGGAGDYFDGRAATLLLFTASQWGATLFSSGKPGADISIYGALPEPSMRQRALPYFTTIFNQFNLAIDQILSLRSTYEKNYEQSLLQSHPVYKQILTATANIQTTLPPSGAIAGIYSAVDGSRGVWKAPANVSLNGVSDLTFTIDNLTQDTLNVDNNGKAINAIRAFTGKGILVWGARTLDALSNEWRYLSVRRFFIMVEESCKNAVAPFVFEPNDANTWVKIRAMIENYLTVLWRQGALAGAKPEQAFFVKVGLGQTMTANDILEGKLIVEIGMAAVRPAEFIILRFMHKMQES